MLVTMERSRGQRAQGAGRPKMGRPPSPRDSVRSNRVVTFVTPAELRKLESIAGHEGKSLSKVVHQILATSLTDSND
jgi:hypothetical protein